MTQLICIEDNALLRSLISTQLSDSGIAVKASVGNCADARRIHLDHDDVVLMDLHLPDGNGLDLGIEMCHKQPNLRIIVLSDFAYPALLSAVPEEFVHQWSYVLKSSLPDGPALSNAIQDAIRAQYVDPAINMSLTRDQGLFLSLDDTKIQILKHIAEGQSNATISTLCNLTPKAIEYHLTKLYKLILIPVESSRHKRVNLARWAASMLPILDSTHRLPTSHKETR